MTCSACGKSFEKKHNSKEEEKGIDLILKYLDTNEWTVAKGVIIEQKDSFDPFSNLI